MARDRNIDLNDSASLPASDDSIEGGTNGASAPVRALRRGFKKFDAVDGVDAPAHREDDDGSTYVGGDPSEMGGFLTRPRGWER
jgi:hypothetical protein